MDFLTGSTSISYLSKVENSLYIVVFNLKVEFKFSNVEFFIIRHTRVYSSKIGRQTYQQLLYPYIILASLVLSMRSIPKA